MRSVWGSGWVGSWSPVLLGCLKQFLKRRSTEKPTQGLSNYYQVASKWKVLGLVPVSWNFKLSAHWLFKRSYYFTPEKKRECLPELWRTSPLNHLLSTTFSKSRIASSETFQHHLQSGYMHSQRFPLPSDAIQWCLIKRKCTCT